MRKRKEEKSKNDVVAASNMIKRRRGESQTISAGSVCADVMVNTAQVVKFDFQYNLE